MVKRKMSFRGWIFLKCLLLLNIIVICSCFSFVKNNQKKSTIQFDGILNRHRQNHFVIVHSNRNSHNDGLNMRNDEEEKCDLESFESDLFLSRRKLLDRTVMSTAIVMATTSSFAKPSLAGELGAKINKLVTQSDLGISVRKSVVKSAQIADQLDGKWEKFSDEFNLGSERSKRDARPKPKDIPPLQPLDEIVAMLILQECDNAFKAQLDSSNMIDEKQLKDRIEKVDGLVRKSFERSGLDFNSLNEGKNSNKMTSEQFNFYSYVRFRAYCDYLVEKKISFPKFKANFERTLGDKLLPIFMSVKNDKSEDETLKISKDDKSSSQLEALQQSLASVDRIRNNLSSCGLVALVDRNELEQEVVTDWSEDLADLQISIALDGDVTQNSQILLQEQGYRLYPSYARVAISSALRKFLPKMEITVDDYYMDTNYNSDPDLFEVKEVLLNIVIANP